MNTKRGNIEAQTLTRGWLNGFLKRNPELHVLALQSVEGSRNEAITADIICEHIARLKAAVTRYNINSPQRIINIDESGVSFKDMIGHKKRYGIGIRKEKLIETVIKTVRKLDNVTLMSVVNGIGRLYKPVFVYPGRELHYRVVRKDRQTPIDWLPHCYFYQRDISSVDSAMFLDWAQQFVEETAELRVDGQYVLLVMDSFAAHVRYKKLQYLKDNRISVIGMPAHTSHILQPLDVSVFSAFKCYVTKEFQRLARIKKVVDAFDVANVLSMAYQSSHTTGNIRSGFHKSGTWNFDEWMPSVVTLKKSLQQYGDSDDRLDSLNDILSTFEQQSRTLLAHARIEISESGTLRLNVSSGVHYTASAVLEALRHKEEATRAREKAALLKKSLSNFIADAVDNDQTKDTATELARLAELKPRRTIQRNSLGTSRALRRQLAKQKFSQHT